MMRTASIGLLIALGFACAPAQAGGQVRLGAVDFTPESPYGAVSYGRSHTSHGFYGHRYYPRAFRHYPRFYGHDHYYPNRLQRYSRHHGLRYHPRRDIWRNYRHFGYFGARGFFFPRGTVVRYVRHRHDAWCGH